MNNANKKIVSGQSMAANYTSPTIDVNQVYGLSFQAVFTGSPVGSFKLQVSSQDVPSTGDVTEWSDVADSETAISAAGNVFYNVTDVFFHWVRIVYTFSSGTGSLNISYMAKAP